MLSIKMIKFNYLIFAFYSFNFNSFCRCISNSNFKKVDEIYVLDLTTYQEFKPKKVETIKPVKKVIEKPKEKIIEKKIIEKKVEKNIPIKEKQKIEEPKPIEKIKKLEKIEKVEDLTNTQEIIEKKTDLNFNQKRVLQNNNSKKLLVDQKIKSFLIKISEEINRIAIKSYPIQSIKRREQGTIIAIIILNSNGDLLEMNFESKRPKKTL